ncbi:efflux MFS transporter YdeE [Siccibacter colletis]|uniref:efflux MFS transporter YdeE n=1 Tax=Siccibacter colletis TaxID=1505757 RepID=UPI0004E194C4|nr:efflux MFS transporter YdeE [Siccibacter colletis]
MLSKTTISTGGLLASSLLLTIGRGATLPFMAIYLTRKYGMAVDAVGIAMSIALTVGVVFSLGFGILADRFDKKRYMLLSILVFITGFIAIPLVHDPLLVVIFFSLINCAYSVFSTVLKGYFADTLEPGAKAKIFSLNYTFLNIGWTIGPPLGTLLVVYSIDMPFWMAVFTSAIPLVLIQRYVQSVQIARAGPDQAAVKWSPSVMLHDRALMWFTLSAFLGSLVGGSFASCISQYLLAVADSDFAQKAVGLVLPVNAAVVVLLQYAVGRRLTAQNLKPLMGLGTLCFILGLGGFMIADTNLLLWGVSVAVFTIGELIYAPGEYMLIDHIAPAGMKSSYFSAQSLGWLGGALNPLVTGVILTTLPAWSLFAILTGAIVLAWLCMLKGMHGRSWDTPRLTAV